MIQPALKALKVIKGTTFLYRFQYLSGSPGQSAPINLTGYTARWSLNWTTPTIGNTIYSTGQLTGHSGVFFGGTNNDLTTGIIDLIITATDTAAIPWTTAGHQFVVTDATGVALELFYGTIAVVRSFPS